MILILGALFCNFISYYFACLTAISTSQKNIFTIFFITTCLLLRVVVNANLNNDYYLYLNFDVFHKPTNFLSFLVNEPYLYSVYTFFSFFIEAKKDIFLAMYWFNFLINIAFFVWLLYREDVEIWKKTLLFVLHYFLFGFVLLRNGPAYILFALYFYYTFRDKKFNWIFITPLMHISSFLILITYFHKRRHYLKVLVLTLTVIFLFFWILKDYLSSIHVFDSILSKITIYSQGMPVIGMMHSLFFIFIFGLFLLGFIHHKKKILHPIIVTTLFFYSFTFFVNPIVAHRFSPYILFALLLYPFDNSKNDKEALLLDRLSVLLFPLFIYSLFNAHRTEGFRDIFIK